LIEPLDVQPVLHPAALLFKPWLSPSLLSVRYVWNTARTFRQSSHLFKCSAPHRKQRIERVECASWDYRPEIWLVRSQT
jgi:hypothetical protein